MLPAEAVPETRLLCRENYRRILCRRDTLREYFYYFPASDNTSVEELGLRRCFFSCFFYSGFFSFCRKCFCWRLILSNFAGFYDGAECEASSKSIGERKSTDSAFCLILNSAQLKYERRLSYRCLNPHAIAHTRLFVPARTYYARISL